MIELRPRSIILAIILTALLAMSNSYLALRLGILTSASIPAAIISMGILRCFKNANILENNLVQTAASAGEAVAGGIVYTIPALIIIQYWDHFDYFTNFMIAASGGILGVLFSIPLRHLLVHDDTLAFPEGRAIAEVLKSQEEGSGIKDIFIGAVVGGLLELSQTGFKILAGSWNYWKVIKTSLFGFSIGFSATMIGAGFLVGFEMALSIFLGALLSWLIAVPLISPYFPELLTVHAPAESLSLLWNSEMRYMGIGAMLVAGIWTFCKLITPLTRSVRASLQNFLANKRDKKPIARTEQDLPLTYILIGVSVMALVLFLFFKWIFPLSTVGLEGSVAPAVVLIAVFYVLFIGFLFAVITAYFSGMVGVTASPGSSIVIAGMLMVASLLLILINKMVPLPLSSLQIQAAEAITIIIGSVVTGIAAIANDNIQDLKVGQLVGATPWRQELMLLLGVIVSALVIPAVMQLLFDVYGIAGVMPHAGMDKNLTLPAPVAAMMAAITEAVFRSTLPWIMMLLGGGTILLLIVLDSLFGRYKKQAFRLSILGVAIGMYLPMSSSFPLFVGGMMAWYIQRQLKKRGYKADLIKMRLQRGVLIACGLVAGSALVDVFLAIPFSIMHSPDALHLLSESWEPYAVFLSVVATILLFIWVKRRVVSE